MFKLNRNIRLKKLYTFIGWMLYLATIMKEKLLLLVISCSSLSFSSNPRHSVYILHGVSIFIAVFSSWSFLVMATAMNLLWSSGGLSSPSLEVLLIDWEIRIRWRSWPTSVHAKVCLFFCIVRGGISDFRMSRSFFRQWDTNKTRRTKVSYLTGSKPPK